MPVLLEPSPNDLLARLGGIPIERIRQIPIPGTATIEDAIREEGCELVDGTLVEKPVGLPESIVASAIVGPMREFARKRKLGVVSTERGTFEVLPELVRIPGVAFISWKKFPGGRVGEQPIPEIAPDLAVEVLSPSNTKAEMKRKRGEYFRAGVELVWMVDIENETVTVYTSEVDSTMLKADDALDGGGVLPGFSLRVGDIFAELIIPE